jgi:hypothetical protein
MRKSSVRGIAVSPFWLLKTKKPPSLAVSGILRRTCSAKSVNLPLFHRQMAGMAKVKIAGKDKRAAHGNPCGSNDYTPNARSLASPAGRVRPLTALCARRHVPRHTSGGHLASGCDNPTANPAAQITVERYQTTH